MALTFDPALVQSQAKVLGERVAAHAQSRGIDTRERAGSVIGKLGTFLERSVAKVMGVDGNSAKPKPRTLSSSSTGDLQGAHLLLTRSMIDPRCGS